MSLLDVASPDLSADAVATRTLVVFSDDWGRHPSSCQHVVRRLLGDHHVVWVNTIGTRPPRLDLNTFRRGIEKLVGWTGLSKRPNTNAVATADVQAPEVVSPVMWPSYRRAWQRRLNRTLVTKAVNRALSDCHGPAVAITTIPLSANLVGALDVGAWVYYCVDDLASWPGLDAQPLREMELELIDKVDAIVTVSEHLRDRIGELGKDSALVSHGVDLRHWQRSVKSEPMGGDVVFWGLIDERLESDWIVELADELADSSVTLVGPVESIDPRLVAHPRVKLLGPCAYDDLPKLANRAAVLVMPYRDLVATRAMQPLKLKEYMATGKPCVVRRLPSTEEWFDCVDVVDTSTDFVAAVQRRRAEGVDPDQQAARKRLDNESWEAKAAIFRQVLTPLFERSDR